MSKIENKKKKNTKKKKATNNKKNKKRITYKKKKHNRNILNTIKNKISNFKFNSIKNKNKDIKNKSNKNIKYDYKTLTKEQIEKELNKEKYKSKYFNILTSTIYGLIIVAAIALIIATIIMPVFQISGSSMEPKLNNGDFVVSIKTTKLENGDIIAFYHGNKILVKRVIASAGQWVVIDKDGNVYVDGNLLEESYIDEKMLGDYDIEFPYQVPNESWFVLGDNRSNSIDSRNSEIGSIKKENIIGKILFKLWDANK